MSTLNVGFGLFSLVTIFNIALYLTGFACLIQLFRFLTKGIRALDIYISEKEKHI